MRACVRVENASAGPLRLVSSWKVYELEPMLATAATTAAAAAKRNGRKLIKLNRQLLHHRTK